MAVFIYIILACLSIRYYRRDKVPEMLLCLTIILTDLFGFDLALGGSSIKSKDFLLVALFAITIMAYLKDHDLFSLEKDTIGKVVLLCFSWTFIVFLGTIITGQESPSFAFKSYRAYLVLPFYFVIRRMIMEEVERYLQLILYCCIVQGVFFYLQFVGVTGFLSGFGSEMEDGVSYSENRFGNYPYLFSDFFFIYYFIKKDISIWLKVFFMVFFGMMPILGQMRGAILVLALTLGLYLLLQRQKKNILYIIIGAMFFQFFIAPMFEKREKDSSSSTLTEIVQIVSAPTKVYQNFENVGGTFTFRIAIYVERIQYLIDHPEYLLTGVGTVHADNAVGRYDMNLGTYWIDDKGDLRIELLSSADITWVGIIMHFGFIGVILFTMLYIVWIKYGIPNIAESTNEIFTTYALLSVGSYFGSYNGEALGRVSMLVFIFTMAVITIYLREHNNN